jgi:HPt (histidine-containing phosphotransfer) domain-containing protein
MTEEKDKDFEEDDDLKDLINTYIASLPKKIEDIREAYQAKEYSIVKELVHKLCGSAGMYGIDLVFEASSQLELDLIQGNFEEVDLQIKKLNTILESLN